MATSEFWTDRPRTPMNADERETLTAFLDWYRTTMSRKCEGLTAAQLVDRRVDPSSLSLLGLVRHMAEVERGWFRSFHGEQTHPRYVDPDSNPDGDFDDITADDALVRDAVEYWTSEIEHAREIVAAHELTDTYAHPRTGHPISLRWILVHMIEEYARHCGHADLLRERLDGTVGD
jgi:uncharacterized damage-inducible protein DinB